MTDKEQITRHEREIGELRGKLDALAAEALEAKASGELKDLKDI